MYGNNLKTIPQGVDAWKALAEVKRRVAGPDGPAGSSQEAKVAFLRSEHFLVRFLIARQWDVEKACTMLREHYQWLAEVKMASLLKDPFPEEAHIKRYYPQAFHGTDKLGRPIYIERPGNIDMPRLLQALSTERLLQYMSVGSELQVRLRLPACSLARGEVIDKSLNIMDLDGLGFRLVTHTTARRVLKDVVAVLNNHYPECAGRTIIVNAPKVFSIAWSFVKPMLDEKTVAKISIYGADREAYSEALLDLIDADQLPCFLGGKCKCDGKDELSCMRSVKGPWADPEVKAVLESEPLERIMTPEGSKLLHQKREAAKAAAEAEAAAKAGAEEGEAPAPGAEAEAEAKAEGGGDGEAAAPSGEAAPGGEAPPPPPLAEGEAKKEGAEAPAPAPAEEEKLAAQEAAAEEEEGELAELPKTKRNNPASTEIQQLELEASFLQSEYKQHEEAHMQTLTQWVSEFNQLMSDIGRQVIERAQGFYDSRSLWQQAVQEYANAKTDLDAINAKLDAAVRDLAKAEAAICGGEALTDEEWARLAPLPEEEGGEASADAASGEPDDGGRVAAAAAAAVDERLEGEAKRRLIRTLRLSALGDKVAGLQLRRDSAKAVLAATHRELEDCKQRFESEEQSHVACTWNCSVKRAAPFYEKRRLHETEVEAQLAVLRSLERRLQQTRQQLAALEGPGTVPLLLHRTRSRQLDELSLQSFEISGGAPVEDELDEFLSCGSGTDDERST